MKRCIAGVIDSMINPADPTNGSNQWRGADVTKEDKYQSIKRGEMRGLGGRRWHVFLIYEKSYRNQDAFIIEYF